MKIAILSDSHGAALRLGWEQIESRHQDVELVFFAQRRNGLADLSHSAGFLTAETESLRSAFRFTSKGLEAVRVGDYNALLVYGLCAAPFFQNSDAFYSKQVLVQTCQDLMKDRLSTYVVNQARLAGARTIYVGHDPLPLEGSLTVDRPRREYLDGLATLNRLAYTKLGAQMVPQPVETTTSGSCTLKRFTNDARRLAVGDESDNERQPAHDVYRHMNADFGALWLENFLDIARFGKA
jgi:hypothetical protein